MYEQEKLLAQLERIAAACEAVARSIERIAVSQERIDAALASMQPKAKAAEVSRPPLPPRVKADKEPEQPSKDGPLSDGERVIQEVQGLALTRIGRYGSDDPASDRQYGLWCGKSRQVLGSDEARHAVTALLAGVDIDTIENDPHWRPSKSECSAWLDWLLVPDSQDHSVKSQAADGLKAIWRTAQELQGQLSLFDPFDEIED